MDISVILTTARFGGFDVLQKSMAQQDFNDTFETIVVDEFYSDRANFAKTMSFDNSVHLPPKRLCRIYDDSLGINTALAAASGELIVVLADYTWAPPNYLQAHWDFYKANPGWSMSCYLDRYELPPMRGEPYSIERDWWSVFQKDFTSNWFDDKEPVYRERRGCVRKIHEDGKVEMPGEFIYLLGDSIPISVVKELNGIDERLCGAYGSNDICVGMRANILGWKFALNPYVKLKKLTLSNQNQVPGKFKPRVRAPEDNYRFVMNKIERIKAGKEPIKTPVGWGAWD